jgi:hypothetical protein
VLSNADSQLTYRVLDDSGLESYLKAHPTELPHLDLDRDQVLVTARPQVIRRFLVREQRDDKAWIVEETHSFTGGSRSSPVPYSPYLRLSSRETPSAARRP